ncbi:hypothetical protein R0131_03825 [Clostridium sp. AL.422]|uniref:hypothetical protein n=1 Tax=Clostridium TaxID=1485 RepID=UPI00293DC0ED|nr:MULTISPECIES: hypothetical protein [unclassified Clostridium]MDV4149957.1 hypothetical protein [Clostridium sp. AL.422]
MDNKELNQDDVINEVIEENKVIEPVDAEVYEETEVKDDSKGIRFLKKILAGAIDQIISIALSLLLLIVVDLLLKLFGFYIVEREPMFLIMYIIVNIIYGPICASTKLKDTIGRKTVLK